MLFLPYTFTIILFPMVPLPPAHSVRVSVDTWDGQVVAASGQMVARVSCPGIGSPPGSFRRGRRYALEWRSVRVCRVKVPKIAAHG